MNIAPDPDFRAVLLDKIEKREFHERKGVHQSDLVYCLNKQVLRRLYPIVNTDADLLLFSLGWSTQVWITGKAVDEDPIEVDGIIVTLDSTYEGQPWELKCSYQSSTRPIEENLPWLKQIMSQCYVTNTTSARLSRMEIEGNYKGLFGKKILDEEGNVIGNEKDLETSRRPTLSAWRLDFTAEELQRNWAWLIDRREKFVALLATNGEHLLPRVVAIPSGQDYECERCSYRGNKCQEI